jgi:hypothetical protein
VVAPRTSSVSVYAFVFTLRTPSPSPQRRGSESRNS